MRLPFFDPRRDEVAAIAADLITRFGLRAHEEALYLAELSLQMGSRRKRVLYELVAREIETSFLEAQRREGLLGRRLSASGYAALALRVQAALRHRPRAGGRHRFPREQVRQGAPNPMRFDEGLVASELQES